MDIGMRQRINRSEHEGTVKEGRISGYYAICPPCRYKGPKREYRIAAFSDLRETHFGIREEAGEYSEEVNNEDGM